MRRGNDGDRILRIRSEYEFEDEPDASATDIELCLVKFAESRNVATLIIEITEGGHPPAACPDSMRRFIHLPRHQIDQMLHWLQETLDILDRDEGLSLSSPKLWRDLLLEEASRG
jgi:hypothetical protein